MGHSGPAGALSLPAPASPHVQLVWFSRVGWNGALERGGRRAGNPKSPANTGSCTQSLHRSRMGGPKNEAKLPQPSVPKGSHALTWTSLKASPVAPECQKSPAGRTHTEQLSTAWCTESGSQFLQVAGLTTSPLGCQVSTAVSCRSVETETWR